MEPEFEKYISEARDRFVRKVNEQEWNTQLRMEAENLLTAFDQMREQIKKERNKTIDEVIYWYVPDGNPELWLNKIQALRNK